MRQSYTMEAERMIHDRLFPHGKAHVETETQTDMDLDAFML
ncbi:hypothetical protein [Devosia ginsengisoli]|nr:hypothetical protein [Devosia ginsengisoli]MCR6669921.1 hypothetical protein [Devosia ginsengisoli]